MSNLFRLAVVPAHRRERAIPDRLLLFDCLRIVLQAEPERPIDGYLKRRRHHEERLVVEVVEMVSDDLVEGEPGGAGLRLDDRRRSILIGEVAVDGVCLEAIGQLRQQLFRPLRVGVLATERRLTRDSVLELQVRCAPMAVVERILSVCTFVRNKCAVSHRAITLRGDRDWIAPHPSRGTNNATRRSGWGN